MDEKALKRWEKTRSKGKQYIIFKLGGVYMGLLGFGLLSILVQIIFLFWKGNYSSEFLDNEVIGQLVFRAAFSYPAGLFWGWIMWTWGEWRYTRNSHSL